MLGQLMKMELGVTSLLYLNKNDNFLEFLVCCCFVLLLLFECTELVIVFGQEYITSRISLDFYTVQDDWLYSCFFSVGSGICMF